MTKAIAERSMGPEVPADRPGIRPFGSLPDSPAESAAKRPPSHLSRRAQAAWCALQETHLFVPHELVTFERALEWFDRSDALAREAVKLRGRERASRIKASADAATAALRFWRTLKFIDPTRPPRPPGRPPGRRPPAPVSAFMIGGGHADGAR